MADILTLVEPRTTTRHSYSLTQGESKAATRKLKAYLMIEHIYQVNMFYEQVIIVLITIPFSLYNTMH